MPVKPRSSQSAAARRAPVILVPDRDKSVPVFDKAAARAGAKVIYGGCKTTPEIEALIARVDPDAVLSWRKAITAKAITGMTRCRHIIREGIGYDVVDVKAATARGIYVSNVPEYCVEEVSTHAMALLLALDRDLIFHHQTMAEKGWAEYWDGRPMPPLDGMRLGIVAFGKIGRAMALKAQAFAMEVLAYDPYLYDDIFIAFEVERRRQLNDLLADCDVISVHAPLTPETRLMFGDEQFKQMKKGAFFVNTARGAIVDLDALDRALASGRLGGAALDVFQREPLETSHPLLKRRNVVVSAHVAYASERSVVRVKEEAIAEAVRVLQGQRPLYLVNPEVFGVLRGGAS